MHPRLATNLAVATLVLTSISTANGASPQKPVELVDLNRATVVELLKVPGMTQSWAERIVRFRPYRTKLDLVEQGVVTPEVYRRIRDGVIAHRVPATGENRH